MDGRAIIPVTLNAALMKPLKGLTLVAGKEKTGGRFSRLDELVQIQVKQR
jgi:hypothetical protein